MDKIVEKKKEVKKEEKTKGKDEEPRNVRKDVGKEEKVKAKGAEKKAKSESEPQKPQKEEVKVDGFDERIQTAIKELQAKDYAAADLLLEDLEKERKGDLNVLILRAAAQNGMEYHLAARRTLEKAMRAHPKSYLPYYNLAYLMFKLEDEGAESAKQYYELGRALGGPKDERLESRFK